MEMRTCSLHGDDAVGGSSAGCIRGEGLKKIVAKVQTSSLGLLDRVLAKSERLLSERACSNDAGRDIITMGIMYRAHRKF